MIVGKSRFIYFLLFTCPDASMEKLYDGGNGRVFMEALGWMKSSSSHLQMSGALAIGNIARSGKIKNLIYRRQVVTIYIRY